MRIRSILARFLSQPRSWFRAVSERDRLEAEMDAELSDHLARLTEDLIRAGKSPAEAARNARIALGAIMVNKEEMRASLGLRWWDELGADLRYAVRLLRKSPGFTAIAVGSLALGIGANTAIFTVAQHMLLDKLNAAHPDQLRMFYWSEPKDGIVNEMWGWWDDLPGSGQVGTSFSFPAYEQMRRDNRSLADVFAFKPYGRMTVTIGGEA